VNADPLYGRTILIVEDEALIALDIADTLTQRGARVIVTASVKTALEHVETGGISAAIVDRHLRDGLCTPVCKQLNELAIPFIMHSGWRLGCCVLIGCPSSQAIQSRRDNGGD